MQRLPAYFIISLVFFILTGVGLAYSWWYYPDSQPINCIYKSYTGKNCPTCGFSRAFSAFIHLQPEEGLTANQNAWGPFLFFFLQFVYRFGVSVYYLTTRNNFSDKLVKSDVVISISLFLLAFLPLIIKF